MGNARDLHVGTRGSDPGWEGVVREGRKVVIACGHAHHNRDESTQTSGQSARHCITSLLQAARDPKYAAELAARILAGPRAYARAWSATSGTIERMTAAAQQRAEALTASLPGIAGIVAGRPVLGYNDSLAVAPPAPGPATCRWCPRSIEADHYFLYTDVWRWRAPGPSMYQPDWDCAPGHQHEPEPQHELEPGA